MISRATLTQMVQTAKIPNPVLKAAISMTIPILGDDIFNRVIPAMLAVIRPLAAGEGDKAAAVFSEFISADDRQKILAFIDAANGQAQ